MSCDVSENKWMKIGRYEEKGILMLKCSVYRLSTRFVARTANFGCRISAVVYVRVEARVHLVANVCGMRSSVCRVGRGTSVVEVRVVPGIDLVANVGVVRAVVCGRGAGRVHAFAVGIGVSRSDTGVGRVASVASIPLVDSLIGNLLVLGCARFIAARFVDHGHGIASDGLASSVNHAHTLADRVAESHVGYVGIRCIMDSS